MRPIDVATDETVAFVRDHLPSGAHRILEIGCGRGEVAARLQHHGYQVIAIDSDEEMVEQARQLGVDARMAQWPNFDETSFDAVLFTSSLHHIVPLAPAVTRAQELLAPSGMLLVDDFAYEEIDPPTSEWCYGMAALLDACEVYSAAEGFIPAFVASGGDFAFWRQHHDHELHTASTLHAALAQAFAQVSVSRAAYLYRYFLRVLPETDTGHAIATRLLTLEQRMAAAGEIQAIGRRFVARNRSEDAP